MANLSLPAQQLAGNPLAASSGQRIKSDQDDAAGCDTHLMRALHDKQAVAGHLTWQKFRPLVSRMLRRALGRGVGTEDVEQQVFLGIFSNIHRLRQPEALRPFVITIVQRNIHRELRQRRAEAILTVLELPETDAIGNVGHPAARHALVHLCRLLGRLHVRQRRAFLLRFLERRSVEEVATELGVSVPTARRAFLHARRRVTFWAQRHPFLRDYVS